jgi:uncharacterized protein (DUF1697 family)
MNRTFVALLRGINVSGTNRLPMAQLVAIAERQLGLENCRTYIQSGNMVFEAGSAAIDGLADRLRDTISRECGFAPHVIVISAPDFDAIIAANPFSEEARLSAKSVHAFLLDGAPDKAALAALAGRDFADDRWQVTKGAIYLHLPNGMGRSKLAASIERILKVPMTARNWTTMLSIQKMLHGE